MKYTVSTSFGKFTLSLFPEDAPATVKNFSTYVEETFITNNISSSNRWFYDSRRRL